MISQEDTALALPVGPVLGLRSPPLNRAKPNYWLLHAYVPVLGLSLSQMPSPCPWRSVGLTDDGKWPLRPVKDMRLMSPFCTRFHSDAGSAFCVEPGGRRVLGALCYLASQQEHPGSSPGSLFAIFEAQSYRWRRKWDVSGYGPLGVYTFKGLNKLTTLHV
jgi:hypothetical protein